MDNLPTKLYVKIFSYLSVKYLEKIKSVNCRFYEIAISNVLWKKFANDGDVATFGLVQRAALSNKSRFGLI